MSNFYKLCIIGGWISLIFLGSISSKKLFPTQKEIGRKIVHIGIGPIILLAWWLEISRSIAISTSLIITLGLIANYKFKFFPIIEDIPRKSLGTIAYGLSITVLLALFWPSQVSGVALGILCMALGDGLAGLIGQNIKSPQWRIFGQTKSLLGSLTMSIIVAIIIVFLSFFTGISLQPLQILALSILATVLEQISPWGIDNFTVPIGMTVSWIVFISEKI